MISSTGIGDQPEDLDVRKFEMVSSRAEITFSVSITLQFRFVMLSMVQCVGCSPTPDQQGIIILQLAQNQKLHPNSIFTTETQKSNEADFSMR